MSYLHRLWVLSATDPPGMLWTLEVLDSSISFTSEVPLQCTSEEKNKPHCCPFLIGFWRIYRFVSAEFQIRCVKWISINANSFIYWPNPMFDHLLESSRWDDSNKWSNIGFGQEIDVLEIKICTLSGALCLCCLFDTCLHLLLIFPVLVCYLSDSFTYFVYINQLLNVVKFQQTCIHNYIVHVADDLWGG